MTTSNSAAAAGTQPATAPHHPSALWWYLTSSGLSMLGNSIAMIVWPWLVLDRTGDPAAAGLVAALIAVPTLIFAYFGGNLIDLLGRKPMSIVSDIISGLSVLAVILVDSTIGLTMTLFVIIGILGAVGDIPGMSARAALIGDVATTTGKSVATVSGYNNALSAVSMLVGPALAGVMMAVLPLGQVLWITAACSLLAALCTMLLRLVPATAPDAAEREQYRGFKGWRKVLSISLIRLLALDTLLAMALVSPYLVVLLPAAFKARSQPELYGLAMSAFAVGIMVTSIIAGKIVVRPRWAWALTMLFYSVGFLLMALLDSPVAVISGMLIAGFGSGVGTPLQNTLVTELVPAEVRGRAFSLFMAVSQVASPIGLSITAAVLAFISINHLALMLAVIWVFFALYLTVRGFQLMPEKIAADTAAPQP